jgi:hypothetical protein
MKHAEQLADKISRYLLTGMHHSTQEGKAAIAAIIDPPPPDTRHAYKPHRKYPWFCASCGYAEHEPLMHLPIHS